MHDWSVFEVSRGFGVQHSLQLLEVTLTEGDSNALESSAKVFLLELAESTSIQASEDATNGDSVILFDPSLHALDDVAQRFGLVLLMLSEGLRCANVLKCAKVGMLHNDSLSLFQSDLISFQLSDALLHLTIAVLKFIKVFGRENAE